MSEETKAPEVTPKKRRGFAAMDPAKVREIASKGGRAVHEKGTAHQFTSEEATIAGKKGGMAPHRVRGRGKQFQPNRPPNAEERTGFLPMPLDGEGDS